MKLLMIVLDDQNSYDLNEYDLITKQTERMLKNWQISKSEELQQLIFVWTVELNYKIK